MRQHITTLNQFITLSIEEFKQFVRKNLCSDELLLSADDIKAIENIAAEYYTPEFIYGNNPAYSIVTRHSIDGVGEFEVRLEVKDGIIRKANMLGDFFLTGDLDGALLARLRGVPYTPDAVAQALADADVENTILNLKKEQLITILFN